MLGWSVRCWQLLPGQIEVSESQEQPKCNDRRVNKRSDALRADKTCANEEEALRSVLLDAGVSPELVSQVLASYSGAAKLLLGDDASKCNVAPATAGSMKLPTRSDDSPPMPETTSTWVPTASLTADSTSSHEFSPRDDIVQLVSPFDTAMKKYVDRKRDDSTLFSRIVSDDASTNRDMTVSIPVVGDACASGRSPSSDGQVVAYTFGEYLADCIRSSTDPDIQVRSIEIAEQYALVIKETCGSMALFEGCASLICLSLEHSVNPRVFRAASQLACTLFEAMDELDPSTTPAHSARTLSLNIVNELPREHWAAGVAKLLDGFLSSDCCWSASTTTQGYKAPMSKPRTVNRYFPQWVRLLLQQSATKRAFVVVCSSTDNVRVDANIDCSLSAALTSTANRLRLFRLLLSTGMDRSALPADIRERITAFCGVFVQDSRRIELVSVASTLSRLAHECLELLKYQSNPAIGNSNSNAKKRVRIGLTRAGTTSSISGYVHLPLFRKHPLNAVAEDQISDQLRRYYDSHPRPHALYRHNFERCDAVDVHPGEVTNFTKGNIHFRGVIEAREPSQSEASFHDRLAQQTRPFVFDLATGSPTQDGKSARREPASAKAVESPFSVLRGTMERRDAMPRIGQGSASPRTSSRLPDIGHQSASTRRGSRDVVAADSLAQASSPRVFPVSPEDASRLPLLSVPASSSLLSTETTATSQTAAAVLARKPSTAQMAEAVSRQTQASRAPPRIAPAERQVGSPDKDACSLQ